MTLPELLSGDVACQHWTTGVKKLDEHFLEPFRAPLG